MAKNLEIYVHTPFCVKKCDYCDFLSFPCDDRTQKQYVDALLQEIAFFGPKLGDYEVSTVYIGGGTPSWLKEEQLVSILTALGQNYRIRPDVEATIECNPGTVTRAKLEKYMQAGINRLSIGLQSADNEELKLLGRIHTYEQFLKTYEMARYAGFQNINVDLISGLPYQTAEKYLKSLHKVIRLKPEHISAYSLIIEKGTPFYDRYKFDAVKQEAGMPTEVLPSEDEDYRMCKLTQKILKEAGYEQYEISNFAKPGYACKHNVGYWSRENYLGLGLGAASLVENVRYSNTRDLYEYMEGAYELRIKDLSEVGANEPKGGLWLASNLHADALEVSRQEQMEEFMFLGLRKTKGVSRRAFEEAFGISIESIYREQLTSLKEEGLLEVREGNIYLTDQGLDLSNYAMAKFLL